MTDYVVYCILFGLVMLGIIAAGVTLIIAEHYGWAWIPWVGFFCLSFRPPPQLGESK